MSTKEHAQHNDRPISKEQPVPEETESVAPAPLIHPSALQRASERPHARPEALLQLQRLHGNRAVGQMLARRASTPVMTPQPKATTPEAQSEATSTAMQRETLEADQDAPEPSMSQAAPQAGSIQRTIDLKFNAKVGIIAAQTSPRNKLYQRVRNTFEKYQETSKEAGKIEKKEKKASKYKGLISQEYGYLKTLKVLSRKWLGIHQAQLPNAKKTQDMNNILVEVDRELWTPKFASIRSDKYIGIMGQYNKKIGPSYINSTDKNPHNEQVYQNALKWKDTKNVDMMKYFLRIPDASSEKFETLLPRYESYIAELEYKHTIAKKLTPAERAAINTYTNQQYKLINPVMARNQPWFEANLKTDEFRGEQAEPGEAVRVNKKIGKMAMSGMKNMPAWIQDQDIYRGETLTVKEGKGLLKGGKKHYPHFVSVSLEKSMPFKAINDNTTAERPFKVLWVIKESKNGKNVAPLSAAANEKEILFAPNTTFVISEDLKPKDIKEIHEVPLKEV